MKWVKGKKASEKGPHMHVEKSTICVTDLLAIIHKDLSSIKTVSDRLTLTVSILEKRAYLCHIATIKEEGFKSISDGQT